MSFGLVLVTAETNCSLTVPLLVTAVSGKTTFGRSLCDQFEQPKNSLYIVTLIFLRHINTLTYLLITKV